MAIYLAVKLTQTAHIVSLHGTHVCLVGPYLGLYCPHNFNEKAFTNSLEFHIRTSTDLMYAINYALVQVHALVQHCSPVLVIPDMHDFLVSSSSFCRVATSCIVGSQHHKQERISVVEVACMLELFVLFVEYHVSYPCSLPQDSITY